MNECLELGLKQFAGRGLRYVVAWRDGWLAWSKELQFQQFHLIDYNMCFLILPEVQGSWNLASWALGANLQRLSADWQAAWGHQLELSESFMPLSPVRRQGVPAGSHVGGSCIRGRRLPCDGPEKPDPADRAGLSDGADSGSPWGAPNGAPAARARCRGS